jgi:hypothetical protein
MAYAASIPTICAACRSAGTLVVEQFVLKGRLSWSESFGCSCGHGFDANNVGLPMPAVRQALMAEFGTFRVFVDAVPKGNTLRAVLTKALHTSQAEIESTPTRLPALVWEGTKLEADFMAAALEKSGATVRRELVGMKRSPPRSKTKRAKKK